MFLENNYKLDLQSIKNSTQSHVLYSISKNTLIIIICCLEVKSYYTMDALFVEHG
jgi:hypothetical protein